MELMWVCGSKQSALSVQCRVLYHLCAEHNISKHAVIKPIVQPFTASLIIYDLDSGNSFITPLSSKFSYEGRSGKYEYTFKLVGNWWNTVIIYHCKKV